MSSKDGPDRGLLERLGWVPVGCAIAAIIVLAMAGLTWTQSPGYGHGSVVAVPRDVGVVPSRTSPVAAASTSTNARKGTRPRPGRPAPVHLSPNRIEIPTLHAQAPIVPVGTTPNGELDVPLNPKIVGWWSPGARPGAAVGTAVFAGHVNYNGVAGELADIGRLRPGDLVLVYGLNASRTTLTRFRVTGVRTYHKTVLPYREIFDAHSVSRLALITCGGNFDSATGNYVDNIVAYAVPV